VSILFVIKQYYDLFLIKLCCHYWIKKILNNINEGKKVSSYPKANRIGTSQTVLSGILIKLLRDPRN